MLRYDNREVGFYQPSAAVRCATAVLPCCACSRHGAEARRCPTSASAIEDSRYSVHVNTHLCCVLDYITIVVQRIVFYLGY